MKTELKEIFSQMAKLYGTEANNFLEMFETPDEQFDSIFPLVKNEINKIYSSKDYQEKIMTQLSTAPEIELKEQKEASETLLKMINEDDTLSANKKELMEIIFNSTLDVISDLIECKRIRVDVGVVRLNPDARIPEYAHSTDAGADIFAIEDTEIAAGETKLVGTGIAVAIPEGYEIQIRPRSGLSLKTSLRVANAPGTIDSEYRGEIKVPIWNAGDTIHVIDKGMKIAQMLIAPTPMIRWNEVETIEELGSTERGSGGFGSTGITTNDKS